MWSNALPIRFNWAGCSMKQEVQRCTFYKSWGQPLDPWCNWDSENSRLVVLWLGFEPTTLVLPGGSANHLATVLPINWYAIDWQLAPPIIQYDRHKPVWWHIGPVYVDLAGCTPLGMSGINSKDGQICVATLRNWDQTIYSKVNLLIVKQKNIYTPAKRKQANVKIQLNYK